VIGLNHRLVLNSDIVIGQADHELLKEFPEDASGDFVVTRTAGRSPALAVNRETAEFLVSFSEPTALLGVVQVIAKRVHRKPEDILEEIYPHLRTFVDRGILVRTGNARRAIRTRRVGEWSLERLINDFDDTSVFLAKNNFGRFGALKLFRKNAGGILERERRALELGGDDLAPSLLDCGSSPLGPYIVSEWKAGSVAAEAFYELRSSANSRPALLRMAIALVEAFERLHQRGILHGDIQPKNVLIDLNDHVWIIDFSHSSVPGLPPPNWRMGVTFFFEPEYAKGALASPPFFQPLSISGENYAIAAMLFYLLSGVHTIEFSVDRDMLLRQIAEAEPRRLMDPQANEWEAVDHAIRPYLSKDPQTRPPSLTPLLQDLASALSHEIAPADVPIAARINRLTPPEEALKAGFGLGSSRLRHFDLIAPRCSLTYGAAGIAYALLRAAELCEDSEFLWAADAWIEQAEQRASEPEAFKSPAIGLNRRTIGYASLACSEPGLFFVKALVRANMGDIRGTHLAVDRFCSSALHRPSHRADVNLGGVGLALAADRLMSSPLSTAQRRQLKALRDQLIAHAWQTVNPDFPGRSRLGFAHGIAGLLFGALTNPKSNEARKAADNLRRLPVMIRKGIRWPVRAGGDFFMPGWCNGVAGHLLMWTRLWQCSHQSDDREMMERIAWGVIESRTAVGNVCCGAAGQALALASFAAATQDASWQKRARGFLDGLRLHWPKDDCPQSLYRGELGLLLTHLECASNAPRFPVWGASLQPIANNA
jgi:hypothetical protein